MDELLATLQIPFNILLTESTAGRVKIYIELRGRSGENPSHFKDKAFGVIEASGLVLFEQKRYFDEPQLKKWLIESYKQLTVNKDTLEQLSYVYKAHAAISRMAAVQGFDFEIETDGSHFYVFRIPKLNEVLKYLLIGPGQDASENFRWNNYFSAGNLLAEKYLGGIITPTQSVDIDDHGHFVLPGHRWQSRYIVQKIVHGDSIQGQLHGELIRQPTNNAKIVALVDSMIDFYARIIAAGVFDIDANRFMTNVRGRGVLMGFDTSHLRDLFGPTNILGPNGYMEDWENTFSEQINALGRHSTSLKQALLKAFAGFNWRSKMKQLQLRIPTRPSERVAAPMAPWHSNLVARSEYHNVHPSRINEIAA